MKVLCKQAAYQGGLFVLVSHLSGNVFDSYYGYETILRGQWPIGSKTMNNFPQKGLTLAVRDDYPMMFVSLKRRFMGEAAYLSCIFGFGCAAGISGTLRDRVG